MHLMIKTNVLITGCEGFIGSHLAELMLNKGANVSGTFFGDTKNIDHIINDISLIELDMSDKKQIETVIESTRPDIIFHLAAQSFVIPSWEDREGTFKVNVLGTMHLLDAVRKIGIDPVIVFASSSAGYGLTNEDEIPIKENKEFRPSSPYAVSKISADMLCYIYWRAYGMKTIRARIFNTIGARKRGNAIADFAQMIVEVEKGLRDSITVGNLEPVLDFTDVRDTVNALWTLASRGKHGEAYNICSGSGLKIKDVLDMMVLLSTKNIIIEVDRKKFRPADDPIFIGDNTKISKLGWRPEIGIDKTLSDTLNYWRAVLE